jgi:hypothetical protein
MDILNNAQDVLQQVARGNDADRIAELVDYRQMAKTPSPNELDAISDRRFFEHGRRIGRQNLAKPSLVRVSSSCYNTMKEIPFRKNAHKTVIFDHQQRAQTVFRHSLGRQGDCLVRGGGD